MKTNCLPLLLLLGISHAVAADPQWLLDARAKEGKLIESHLVTSADKVVSFSVPIALSEDVKLDKDSYYANFRLGPEAVGQCELSKDDIDIASSLRAIAQSTFSDVIEPAQGKIEKRGVELVDAGVAGATPYLTLSWLYVVKDGKGPKLGALRQYAASRSGHGIYCVLVDLGYAKTFDTVVRALIGSLKRTDDANTPNYSEVSLATLGDKRVGYTEITMRRDPAGDTKSVNTTSMLFSDGSATLNSNDTILVEWVRPDGTLINGKHISSVNGEIETDLALTKGEDESWTMQGKFKGKEVKEVIPAGVPSTSISETFLLRTLLAKENRVGAEASQTAWSLFDPGHFLTETFKVLAAVDAATYSVRDTIGSYSVDLVVEQATGRATHGVVQVGPTAAKFDRVYTQGSF